MAMAFPSSGLCSVWSVSVLLKFCGIAEIGLI
jgi:hypothetical protein